MMRWLRSQQGMSLTELLVAILLGSFIMLALALPFSMERRLFLLGERQIEAQRDAHFVMRMIARVARESTGYTISVSADTARIDFTRPCGTMTFEGGPGFNGGEMEFRDDCNGATETLIDAGRSEITQFDLTEVEANRLVDVRLQVEHRDQRAETLETRIFLRNG